MPVLGVLAFLAGFVFGPSTPSPEPAHMAIAWIETPKVKYPTWNEAESKGILIDTIDRVVRAELTKQGYTSRSISELSAEILGGRLDLSKPKERTPEKLRELSTRLDSRLLLVIDLRKFDQKNTSTSAILNSGNPPGSTTHVEVGGCLYDAKDAVLDTWSDRSPLKGSANGPFFGTTKMSEMSGSPDDKVIMARNENRKRMEAIGRAIWNAIGDRILARLR